MSLVGVYVWRCSTASDDQLSVIHGMSDEIQVLKSKHQSFQDQYSTCTHHFHAVNVMNVLVNVCVSGCVSVLPIVLQSRSRTTS